MEETAQWKRGCGWNQLVGRPLSLGADIRIWFAKPSDFSFCLHLCKRFRDQEFFYVPDATLRDEIYKGNVIAFDFNRLEAGYIWVSFPKSGRCRINQIAVDEDLWRNRVGTSVVAFFEEEVIRRNGWSVYLSCNTNTPGHNFWPTVGYTTIIEKLAGRRGGNNVIWAKLLNTDSLLFAPGVDEVKQKYTFQSSISESKRKRTAYMNKQSEMFSVYDLLKESEGG